MIKKNGVIGVWWKRKWARLTKSERQGVWGFLAVAIVLFFVGQCGAEGSLQQILGLVGSGFMAVMALVLLVMGFWM